MTTVESLPEADDAQITVTGGGTRFGSARGKLARARGHLDALHQELAAYRDLEPLRSYRQEMDDGLAFKVQVRHPLPDEIPLIVGDCVHNLRSSLDHIVYECVAMPNNRRCQFPTWGDRRTFTEAEWWKTVKSRVPGASARRLRDALRPLRPYEGGSHEFIWLLAYLDDVDKHRLVLAVSAAVQALASTADVDITTNADRWIAQNVGRPGRTFLEVPTGPTGEALFRDAELDLELFPEVSYPLRDGLTVLTYQGPGWAAIRDHSVEFDIVLAEPARVAGVSLLETLEVLCLNVETLTERLADAAFSVP